MWFSLNQFPIPQYFFGIRLRNCSRHRDQFAHVRKTINVSFEKIQGIVDTFFVREWLRQKGGEKLCDVFGN